jgi:large subunit ribosomal protein L17
MRHRVAGRKLGRTSEHRLALLRNLSTALFEKERIRTTLAKARELRPFAEKLVTLSKKETLHARRRVLRHIHDRNVVAKLFDTLSARYAERPGGYTRILKLGPRRGDCAEMAIIEMVDSDVSSDSPAKEPTGKTKKKARRSPAPSKKRSTRKAKSEEAEGAADKPKKTKTTKKKSKSTAKKKASKAGGKKSPSRKKAAGSKKKKAKKASSKG